jgi:hypothetical protein
MKKITLVLAFIGTTMLNSCTTENIIAEDIQDNDTVAEVFELRNVNFVSVGGGVYEIFRQLNPNILSSDQILIYRMSATVNSTTPIWQMIPRTIYFSNGDELDYDFDFSRVDFSITASGTYDLSTRPIYLNNQTFRIVIVPGYFSGRYDASNIYTVMNLIGKTEADVKVMQ